MSIESTRREFLKTAGAAGLASVPSKYSAWVKQTFPTFHRWITDDDRRLAAAGLVPLNVSDRLMADAVTVDAGTTYQTILGFGAAFTDAACYLFHRFTDAQRAALFHQLFHASEMSLNVCRTCIGAADSATELYSYDEGEPDPDLKRFSIEHDRAYLLPILREASRINNELFLFSSAWSPPGWMKDNGSMLGGCMRHTYMPSYANYLAQFIRAYAAEGVTIDAITVQNEVDADQQGLMPACFWPQEYEADFVRLHLGPRFAEAGISAKIWIIDHNYNLWGRAIAELETPGVRKYTRAIAWHGYSGQPEWMSRVHDAFPDVDMHWTEGSPDYNDPEYSRCWAVWGQKFNTILRNHCRSITAWNFATDEHGRPNIGPYPCGGLMTVDSKTNDVYHSGQYYALGHFSRFVRRGAVRIGSDGGAADLSHCAFRNPDGTIVIVLANPGTARTCQLRLHQQSASISLSANSVTTLVSEMAG